jgi:transcriptional regulator with XRE-family HTH domain
MLNMTIEERLQTLRKGKGLSQEQLAEVLGVSRQAVSKWESGQSLPEIEKLIAMSELFEVSADYILKGGVTPAHKSGRNSDVIGSQIISAVAAMLLAVAIIAVVGQISDGETTMDIYSGLVIESVGIMLLLIGFFVGGGRILSKPLFVVNILLAGALPSSLIAQTLLRYYPRPFTTWGLLPLALFAGAYVLICGTVLYYTLLRKKAATPKH